MEAAAPKLKCEIVTPEGVAFNSLVSMAVVPGSLGELGILPRHAPLVSGTVIGEARVRLDEVDESWESLAVGGGYVKMQHDYLLLLVESAEPAGAIDADRASEALARSQELLARGDEPEIDTARAELARQRALNRLRVAGKL